ncbi:hypothetical protein [Herpetosiphon llansteffanensis]|uniref:hypothetical protein n=1 Tax=Herpetosiphon llansteffanensis TaxID=2094568 RepID=UPI000D7CFB14|nr:hypothetical protein [Herpetosiphon llansteffanensis]
MSGYKIIMNYGEIEVLLAIGRLDQEEALIIQRQLSSAVRSVFDDIPVVGLRCIPNYRVELFQSPNGGLELV